MSKTQLYRHWDKDGNLLYVGISLSAVYRLSQHNNESHWSNQIASVTVENYGTRDDALRAERSAISQENPRHNLYRPKAREQKEAESQHERSDKERIVRRLVHFNPIYTPANVGDILGVSDQAVRHMCQNNEIGHVIWRDHLKNTRHGQRRVVQYRITGWQLIEYLEKIQADGKA